MVTFEHGRILQHVGYYEEPDFGAADVNVLQLGHTTVPVGYGDVLDLAVHVVFGFNQLATVHLPSDGLAGDDVTLGLGKIPRELLGSTKTQIFHQKAHELSYPKRNIFKKCCVKSYPSYLMEDFDGHSDGHLVHRLSGKL